MPFDIRAFMSLRLGVIIFTHIDKHSDLFPKKKKFGQEGLTHGDEILKEEIFDDYNTFSIFCIRERKKDKHNSQRCMSFKNV